MLLEIQPNRYLNIANLVAYHPHTGRITLISQKSIELNPEDNKEFMLNFVGMKAQLPGFIWGPHIVLNLAHIELIEQAINMRKMRIWVINKTYYDLTGPDFDVVHKILQPSHESPRIVSPHN
jgi:hypothetical protein